MSQIYPQSYTHRNPAHAPPAADEPTRIRISEESGMQKDQHNTQSTTALLCKETSVDTLETNSLCCTAADIIAPSSSRTEALIPHEKLREAASPAATLSAQNGPLAQPAMGYTHRIPAKTIDTEILSEEELADLTGYKQRAHQRRWLKEHSWVFIESRGGRPLVGRMYARMKFGMTNPTLVEQSPPPTRPVWTPDFSRVN